MKVKEILLEMYTAYVLSDESREQLMKKFPPKYDKVVAHHITVEPGVPNNSSPPPEAELKVVGYADSKDGLEALIVAVDGQSKREDGSTYHITWSLDPDKYKPVDSNKLVKGRHTMTMRTPISVTPEVLK